MIIGLDLDQTLIETDIINRISHQMGFFPEYSQETAKNWEFSNFPKSLQDALHKEFRNPVAMNNGLILGQADELLVEWTTNGHYIVCITSRCREIRCATMDLIAHTFPMISELTFVDIGESKREQFKRHKLDVWIDDNPKGIVHAHTCGINTFMISNNRTPYNHCLYSYCDANGIPIVEGVNRICLPSLHN